MKYICETCGKVFDSEDKCVACEKVHREEQERKVKLKAEKEKRVKEVNDAYKNANELRNKLIKDYPETYDLFSGVISLPENYRIEDFFKILGL